MKCPVCEYAAETTSEVPVRRPLYTIRSYACGNCPHKWTSIEILVRGVDRKTKNLSRAVRAMTTFLRRDMEARK